MRIFKLRRLIKFEAGKKFDGDYDILLKNLLKVKFDDGENFEEKLILGYIKSKTSRNGQRLNFDEATSRVRELFNLIPRLQISVPINFESWNEEKFISLVAYHPVGIDDREVKEVKALDHSGRSFLLDAWRKPEHPVIVLGINERIDDLGNLKYGQISFPILRESEPGEGGSSGGSSSGNSDGSNTPSQRQNGCLEILEALHVIDDAEPWTKGDAEIRLKIQCESYPDRDLTLQIFDGFNDDQGWRTVNRNLMNWWIETYGNFMIYFWYEEDVGGANLPVSISYQYKNFTFSIGRTWYDSDDQLGWAPVHFLDPYRNTYPYQTGNVEWYDKWINITTSGRVISFLSN